MRVIHFEDSIDKYMEISNQLKSIDVTDITLVSNLKDGMALIHDAIAHGKPFDLAITDMHFPLQKGTEANWEAGKMLIESLRKANFNLPVIVCSSMKYQIPGAYGSIWFSVLSDWEWELCRLIRRRRAELL